MKKVKCKKCPYNIVCPLLKNKKYCDIEPKKLKEITERVNKENYKEVYE